MYVASSIAANKYGHDSRFGCSRREGRASITIRIQYYSLDRVTLPAPVLALESYADAPRSRVAGQPLSVNRIQKTADGRMLLEIRTIPGRFYLVEYSGDADTWLQAVPVMKAAGERIFWYDDGPPETDSSPSESATRFYRVLLLP